MSELADPIGAFRLDMRASPRRPISGRGLASLARSHQHSLQDDIDFGGSTSEASAAPQGREKERVPRAKLKKDLDPKFKDEAEGGGWVYSGAVAVEHVGRILEWREEVAGTNPPRVLPKEMHKEIKRRHFDSWVNDERQVDTVEAVKKLHDGTKHKVARDLASKHRVACYERFGGLEWMEMIIALGHLDDLALACMNQAMAERVAKKREEAVAKGIEWGASASSRGRDPLEVRGVQHKKSGAKVLREQAKRLQRTLQKEDEKWERGDRRNAMAGWLYYQKKRELEGMWDAAEEASQRAGVEYTDRFGKTHFPKKSSDSLVGRALEIYRESMA